MNPKEMLLRDFSNRTDDNAYLPEFTMDFNRRFLVKPRSSLDMHSSLTAQEDLACTLTWQETRSLFKNFTLQFHKTVYQVQADRPTYALRNAQVTVCVNAQEDILILYHGKTLPYTIYKQQPKQAQVVSTKQLDLALTAQKCHAVLQRDISILENR